MISLDAECLRRHLKTSFAKTLRVSITLYHIVFYCVLGLFLKLHYGIEKLIFLVLKKGKKVFVCKF